MIATLGTGAGIAALLAILAGERHINCPRQCIDKLVCERWARRAGFGQV